LSPVSPLRKTIRGTELTVLLSSDCCCCMRSGSLMGSRYGQESLVKIFQLIVGLS
jgi:hypothetical protein